MKAKPGLIPLGPALEIPILYEDRSVLAIDKPAGWLLAPSHWERTGRNLQLAITSSIKGGAFWARSRNVKFLRFVHRLDADTSGVLLFAKSPGSIAAYSRLFESRQMHKAYLAVVRGIPQQGRWASRAPLGQDPRDPRRMRVDHKNGKEAETSFELLETAADRSLVLARPLTGRTHQIRVHLAEAGHPVLDDELYGPGPIKSARKQNLLPLALRAIELSYRDPFTRREVTISASSQPFKQTFGFF